MKCQLFPKSSVTGACDQVKLRLLGLDDLQKDRAHTCRKAIENQGLVLVLNNMFDKCLQTQQPFWRKSIFLCLAAGTVLVGQLRLFELGRSPTFSCCQTSNSNKLNFSTRHFTSLLQLNCISAAEFPRSPFSQMLALLPPGLGCRVPQGQWPLAPLPCATLRV